MKIKYLIQDVKTKEYYWQYRIDQGFNANVDEAKYFNKPEDAEVEMEQEYPQELFEGKWLTIVEYFDFT